MSKPYHLSVVELPDKYPGTMFAIRDSRTNSLLSDELGGKHSVIRFDDRGTGNFLIWQTRSKEAKEAAIDVMKQAADTIELHLSGRLPESYVDLLVAKLRAARDELGKV